jgi:hypothetical protein
MNYSSPHIIAAFDPVVERFLKIPTSFSEKEALKENFWNIGEDARLREDFRFRQTPGGRWIISECLLANDELRKLFTQKHRSSLAFEDAMIELGSAIDRKWVFCPVDKRFVFEGENLRLSEQELTNSILSEDARDMEKYVSHLPIINLKAVAASEPKGEWGPEAQEDMGNILGWVRVDMPGVVLNDRMFVARIKGHSMDDGRRGIVDGSYSLFELWPVGSRQGKIILVRGSFHDPETGNYAVKKYMADQRDEEGLHGNVKLVSLNPDKEKYPDIELDPEDDQAVVVIARHIKSLSGHQYGREPKPAKVKLSGRRNLAPEYVKNRLRKRVEQIFGSHEAISGRKSKENMESCLVCLDFESGGLHVETIALKWLPNFVKKITVQTGGKDHTVILGPNLKNLTWRQMVPPSRDGYTFVAPGFEEDIGDDLTALAIEGLSYEAGTAFKVDAAGIGRLQKSKKLSPGQEYRLLIPPVLRIDSPIIGDCNNFINGWQLWDFILPVEIEQNLKKQISDLQLELGKIVPQLFWTAIPPVDYNRTIRGEILPCFHIQQPPIIMVKGTANLPGELNLYVIAGNNFQSFPLPRGEKWFIHLKDLPVGPVLVQLLHKKTNVAPVTLPLFMTDKEYEYVSAEITMDIDGTRCVTGKNGLSKIKKELAAVNYDDLMITGPPLWPVRSFWKGDIVSNIKQICLTEAGGLDCEPIFNRTKKARRSFLPGDWIFDFAELGQVQLQHGGNPDPDDLQRQFASLIEEKGNSLLNLVGQYQLLKQIWLEPVFQLMGLEYQELSQEVLKTAPAGTTALLLIRIVRQSDGSIKKEKHSMCVLVPDQDGITQKGKGSTWEYADFLCEEHEVTSAIISDGFLWMRHRFHSKMRGKIFPLIDIIKQENGDDFEPFLSACGGW